MPLLTPYEDKLGPFIPPRADAVARLLGAKEQIRALYMELQKQRLSGSTKVENETIFLKISLADIIQFATLQTQDAITRIDLDIVEASKYHSLLVTRRDRGSQIKNIATFMSSGVLSVLASSIGFGSTSPTTTRVMGTLSGSTATLLPTLNFYHKKVEQQPVLTSTVPNMLAQVFDRKTDERSQFNSFVWRYLNEVPPGTKQKRSRLQLLRASWEKSTGLSDPESRREIDFLAGIGRGKIRGAIELLETRIDLLSELRAEVGRLYNDLAELKVSIIGL